MTQFLSFNINQFYNEIKERAESEGVADKEGYDSLVEEYIQEKISVGEIDKDDDTDSMIEELKTRWADYEKNLNIRWVNLK